MLLLEVVLLGLMVRIVFVVDSVDGVDAC